MTSATVQKGKELTQEIKQAANPKSLKLIFRLVLTSSTLILFISTGLIQFSCYPMVTAGNLPKSCKKQAVEIVQNARTHGNVLIHFASNPDLGEDEMRALVSSLDRPHVSTSPRDVQAALAFNPKTPADVLEKLTKSEDPVILSQIASRQNATDKVFQALVKNPSFKNFDVRIALVNNSKTPVDVLREVANYSSEIEIKQILASNSKAPEDLLQNLASVEDVKVLNGVVNNRVSSTKVLDIVGENSIVWNHHQYSFYFQKILAENEKLSNHLAEKLSHSQYEKVLKNLRDNLSPNISSELRKLVSDKLSDPAGKLVVSELPVEPAPISKANCKQKHSRNNLIGLGSGGGAGAAALLLLTGPAIAVEFPIAVGLGVYSLVTGGLELFTRC